MGRLPKCLNCKTDNHLDRKTCKRCDQALFSDEGQICNSCQSLNGPFAEKCRSCGHDFKNSIVGNIQILLQGGDSKDANKVKEFKEKLQTSYLYSNNTFAGKSFSIFEKNNNIEFYFADQCYILKNIEELSDLFNKNLYEIPKFIKTNAYIYFKPIFLKYNKYPDIQLLSHNLENEDVLLTFKNKNNQLASLLFLPIFENEIEAYIDEIVKTCEISDSYLNATKDDDPIEILIDMFHEYQYRYELINKKEDTYMYRIGNKTIYVKSNCLKETLTIDYLNQTIVLTKEDFLFLSILLLNWMINCHRSSMMIDERILNLPLRTVRQISYSTPFNESQVYLFPEVLNLIIEVKTQHILNIKFKEVSIEENIPIHPNMERSIFENMMTTYIRFSNDNKIMKNIKMIEDSTKNHLSVSQVAADSCYVHVNTNHVLMSSIYITKYTSFDEIIEFIKKINFIEQIIEN